MDALHDKEPTAAQAVEQEVERPAPALETPFGPSPAVGQSAELLMASAAPRSLDEVAAGAVLERGMRGSAVKALQALLKIAETGAFDEDTVAAVKAFQVEGGLSPVSGRVGPTTLKALRARSPEVSAEAAAQMARLVAVAESGHRGASRGDCFKYVWGFIVKARYGKITRHDDAPDMPSGYARNFAEYMNSGNNAQRWGLKRLSISNPYDAPRGAIVVVGPGTPGTRHPTAGDIAVARGDGSFINDGPNMRYGPPARFAADGGTLLGAYVPDV